MKLVLAFLVDLPKAVSESKVDHNMPSGCGGCRLLSLLLLLRFRLLRATCISRKLAAGPQLIGL